MPATKPAIPPRLVLTPGEPAGIGPDVVIMAAQRAWQGELLCIADETMMRARAEQLGLPLTLLPYTTGDEPELHQPGTLRFVHVKTAAPVTPGALNTDNAAYVLATITLAAEQCRFHDASALVTGPVHKSVINDAGIPFSGHTEFLAEHFDCERVVMMLAADDLRMALATTHLPLAEVPSAITQASLESTLRILHNDLSALLGCADPRITVLGLNPHAGEDGHLGREEIEVIAPVINRLREEGMQVAGPLPADTAFTPALREQSDAYLAMYHDQGLPVLKAVGFGEAVNVTLGLPIIRTSVDHGTALPLAGTGQAQPGSLLAAIDFAFLACGSRSDVPNTSST